MTSGLLEPTDAIQIQGRATPCTAASIAIDDAQLLQTWIAKDFVVKALDTLPDRNGNGAEELAALAVRPEHGRLNFFIRDGRTGELLERIWF